MPNESGMNYQEIKTRLDEIVDLVSDDSLALDDALSLYEEAVSLGLQASNLLEKDLSEEETQGEVVSTLAEEGSTETIAEDFS
ncbi:MAG: exodeoxyribonuclease VII small subunit [Anaerotardibacter sp.]